MPPADARRVSGSRRGRRAACAAALAVGAFACAREAPAPRLPSVLILTLDTTRADHLGAFGYFRDTSPELDALARESIVFDSALAPMATTLPTHVSVFTGTDPLEHGVLANTTQGGQRFVPAPLLRPAAAVAAEAGYATAAFVSAAPLKRGSGVETGFATFDEPEEKHRPSTGTVDAAIAWLEANGDAPFFLWVHLYDAHWPYAAPPPYDRLFATDDALEAWIAERRVPERAFRPLVGTTDESRPTINAYDGALRYQDAELGRLLRWLRDAGRLESTAILLLGDHGEGLGQHDEIAHGGTWNEQLHAPLLMRIPGEAPRRVAEPLSLVDAMPTFLARLAVPGLALPEGQASGRDALAGAAEPAAILSRDTGREREGPHRVALRAGRWKYFRIEDPGGGIRDALYDLESDPFELEDVAVQHAEQAAVLRRAVEERTRALSARGEALRAGLPAETRPLEPELREQLEALGYAAGGAPPAPAAAAPVPEPDAEQVARLRALGYVDHAEALPEGSPVGVVRIDRGRAQPGLNYFTEAKACASHLMDMEGRILRSWTLRPCHRWDNTLLLPQGEVLATARVARGRDPASADAARVLLRLDWDATVRWTRALRVHHDVGTAPQGRILVLTHRLLSVPEIHPSVPVRDNLIVLLSSEGEPLGELSLLDLFRNAPDVLPLQRVEPARFEGSLEIDLFHANAIEWLDRPAGGAADAVDRAGTILLTMRNQDAIAVIDWAQKRALWAWGRGELRGPHDATRLSDGRLLVFDNGLGRGWSRVVEVDPGSGRIVWEYRAPQPESFHTPSRGAAQRLANGNTLVTESDGGRAFEVTRDGDIVWEFVDPHLTPKREPEVIVRMRRLEGLDASALEERVGEGKLPVSD